MAEPEDEDTFPNDYDGLDFDNIPGLQAPTISTPEVSVPLVVARSIVLSAAASPVPSTGSSSVDDMDSSFLAAVDALEARVLSEMPRDLDPESLPRAEPGGHPTDGESALSLKLIDECLNLDDTLKTVLDSPPGGHKKPNQFHVYSMQSPEFSMDRKGKRKAQPQEDIDVRAILGGYETELTCPICCDLLVGAQVTNPCGHTCCGECGYGWLAQNKYEPTCAVCRSSLSARKPLLPNFSVDNFVRQHLRALATSGRPEWQEKGYRTIEWNKRLESWKELTAIRSAKEKSNETPRVRRRQPRFYQVEDYSYAAPWLIDESMDDGEEPLVVVPRRGTRSRH